MGKYHNVLYIALKIAWDFGCCDSDVVKTLLCTLKIEQKMFYFSSFDGIYYAFKSHKMWHYIDSSAILNKSPHNQSSSLFTFSYIFSLSIRLFLLSSLNNKKCSENFFLLTFLFVCLFLLGEIFECEHNFERIFLGAIFGSNAPYFIAGWRSDFLDQV